MISGLGPFLIRYTFSLYLSASSQQTFSGKGRRLRQDDVRSVPPCFWMPWIASHRKQNAVIPVLAAALLCRGLYPSNLARSFLRVPREVRSARLHADTVCKNVLAVLIRNGSAFYRRTIFFSILKIALSRSRSGLLKFSRVFTCTNPASYRFFARSFGESNPFSSMSEYSLCPKEDMVSSFRSAIFYFLRNR